MPNNENKAPRESGDAVNKKPTVYTEINRAVSMAIYQINDDPGKLSELRKGVGKSLDEIALSPQIAKYVYATTYSQAPEAQNYNVTKIERAIYTALTTYAAVSGHRGSDAHDSECKDSLGTLIGQMRTSENEEKALRNRFERLVTSEEFESTARCVGDFTSYLNKLKAVMNYGKFAYELYQIQTDENRNKVMNRWGRNFETSVYKNIQENLKKEEKKEGKVS